VKIATAAEMAAVDRASAERHGVPVAQLMEAAGERVAAAAAALLGGLAGKRVALVCGRGNNGGDGLVAARRLLERGAVPLVLLAGDPAGLRPDARDAWEAARRAGVELVACADAAALAAHRERALAAELVVDALLGTGFAPPARGAAAAAIDFVNALGRPVLAVDLPSGLAADHGRVDGPAVRAQATVTFGFPKACLVLHPAAALAGRVWVAGIGFPPETDALVRGDLRVAAGRELAALLGSRDPQGHKGTYGHVLVVGGARGMLGAAVLASRGALRAGAGRVTAVLPAGVAPEVLPGLPEALLGRMPDAGDGSPGDGACAALLGRLGGAQALAVGPGLSLGAGSAALVRGLLAADGPPLVLDADALSLLADLAPAAHPAGGRLVLTPHPGEMGRLLGTTTAAVQRDRVAAARECAARYGAVVVLKGARSVVTAPGAPAWFNPTGNPGMAAAGMGDVLAGAIAAHLARGMAPLEAALLGAHLHGLAGDLAAAAAGPWGILASEVADRLPEAARRLSGEHDDDAHEHLELLVP
jgi:NAD(P)H-hydrate epimerase